MNWLRTAKRSFGKRSLKVKILTFILLFGVILIGLSDVVLLRHSDKVELVFMSGSHVGFYTRLTDVLLGECKDSGLNSVKNSVGCYDAEKPPKTDDYSLNLDGSVTQNGILQEVLSKSGISISHVIHTHGSRDNANWVSSDTKKFDGNVTLPEQNMPYFGLIQEGIAPGKPNTSGATNQKESASPPPITDVCRLTNNAVDCEDKPGNGKKHGNEAQGKAVLSNLNGRNIYSLACMYRSSMQIVARAGLEADPSKYDQLLETIFTNTQAVRDSIGKHNPARQGNKCRVYLGESGSGAQEVAKQIVRCYGVDPDEGSENLEFYSGKMDTAKKAFESQQMDVGFYQMGYGSKALLDLIDVSNRLEKPGTESPLPKDRLVLLNLTRAAGIARAFPKMRLATLKPGIYPAKKLLQHEIETIEINELLVCNRSVDDYTAYHLIHALNEAKTELLQANLVASDLDIKAPEEPLYYPMHSGAVTYFKHPDSLPLSRYFYSRPLGFLKQWMVWGNAIAVIAMGGLMALLCRWWCDEEKIDHQRNLHEQEINRFRKEYDIIDAEKFRYRDYMPEETALEYKHTLENAMKHASSEHFDQKKISKEVYRTIEEELNPLLASYAPWQQSRRTRSKPTIIRSTGPDSSTN